MTRSVVPHLPQLRIRSTRRDGAQAMVINALDNAELIRCSLLADRIVIIACAALKRVQLIMLSVSADTIRGVLGALLQLVKQSCSRLWHLNDRASR